MLTSTWLSHGLLALTTISQCNAESHMYHDVQHPFNEENSAFSEDPLLSLHRNLVEIQSITGNEHDLGEYLHGYLVKSNFTVEKQQVEQASKACAQSPPDLRNGQSRFNLLAYPGSSRNTRILLSSHYDTVPPFWPYEVRGQEIWGRGSVDDKACVATQIIAVEELLASNEIGPGDVALLFVVGEETTGDGMRRANDLGLSWETAIFGEPTELKLASGHKGLLPFTIKATGKAAHSGYPWLGESANSMLIPALAKLDRMQLPWSEKYGPSTLNIGKVEGGVAMNVIAETATAGIAIRVANGTAEQLKEIILGAVREVDERLEVTFSSNAYGPVDIDHDVEGFERVTVNYGTDIPNLKGLHKRYLYGPGSILVAHSDHEHLTVGNLTAAVEGYKRIVRHALKKK
ncbi:MAG: hypothetical protein Q9191_004669 [Dirinaria sp. TL-2023a]